MVINITHICGRWLTILSHKMSNLTENKHHKIKIMSHGMKNESFTFVSSKIYVILSQEKILEIVRKEPSTARDVQRIPQKSEDQNFIYALLKITLK